MDNHKLPFDPGQGEPATRAHALNSAGPVHAFSLLVDALAERDHGRVTDARKELRRRGFDVWPLGTPRKAVRPS